MAKSMPEVGINVKISTLQRIPKPDPVPVFHPEANRGSSCCISAVPRAVLRSWRPLPHLLKRRAMPSASA